MTSKPKQQLNLLDSSTPAWKLILMLAWPTVVEQLLQTAVNYVDTAMVGYMGTNATAALGLTSSTIWLLMGVMNAAGVGYSVMVARRLGAGRPDEAREVIRQADAPVQVYANRSDLAGGSTLGSIANTKVPVNTVDIGLPQLAMHSAVETAGVEDLFSLVRAMTCYFSKTLVKEPAGVYCLK